MAPPPTVANGGPGADADPLLKQGFARRLEGPELPLPHGLESTPVPGPATATNNARPVLRDVGVLGYLPVGLAQTMQRPDPTRHAETGPRPRERGGDPGPTVPSTPRWQASLLDLLLHPQLHWTIYAAGIVLGSLVAAGVLALATK